MYLMLSMVVKFTVIQFGAELCNMGILRGFCHSTIVRSKAGFISLPYAVENVSVWVDPDVQVGLDDVVKVSILFIAKKCIWHPNLPGIGKSQVTYVSCNVNKERI